MLGFQSSAFQDNAFQTLSEVVSGGGSGWYILPTGKIRNRRIEDDITLTMREIYEGVIEEAPPKIRKQAAKIIKPFIEANVKSIEVPPASAIDWKALERDVAKVSALLALWEAQVDMLREEEDILLLLMAA